MRPSARVISLMALLATNEMRFLGPDWVVYRSTLTGQRIPKAGGDPVPFETKYFDLLHRKDAGGGKSCTRPGATTDDPTTCARWPHPASPTTNSPGGRDRRSVLGSIGRMHRQGDRGKRGGRSRATPGVDRADQPLLRTSGYLHRGVDRRAGDSHTAPR